MKLNDDELSGQLTLKKEAMKVDSNTKLPLQEKARRNEKWTSFYNNIALLLQIVLVTLLVLMVAFFVMNNKYGNLKTNVLINDYQFVKPLGNTQQLKVIKLRNGLDVLVINDQSSNKQIIQLTVGSGLDRDFSKSYEYSGGISKLTARFFSEGTSKVKYFTNFKHFAKIYKGKFLSKSFEEATNYYIETNSRGVQQALELLAKTISNPYLLEQDFIEKNLDYVIDDIINEENRKRNKKKNLYAEMFILKSLSKGVNHPYQFIYDPIQLKKMPKKHLSDLIRKFFLKEYRPKNMKLIVKSSLIPEYLENAIESYFGAIKGKNKEGNGIGKQHKNANIKNIDTASASNANLKQEVQSKTSSENQKQVDSKRDINSAFPKETKFIWFKTKEENNILNINFFLKETKKAFLTKPLDYFTYLFNYKGLNSLDNVLKSEGLIEEDIDAKISEMKSNYTKLHISCKITDKGVEMLDRVILLIDMYIEAIKGKHVNESVYKEIMKINDVKFLYSDNPNYNTYESISSIGINMLKYPFKVALDTTHLHEIYDEDSIKSNLKSISIETAIIVAITKKELKEGFTRAYMPAKITDKEVTSGTTYSIASYPKISKNLLNSQLPKLKIREDNEFSNFSFFESLAYCYKPITINNVNLLQKLYKCEEVKQDPDYVQKVFDDNKLTIWYKMDRKFGNPKLRFYVKFVSPVVRNLLTNMLSLEIYLSFMSRNLKTYIANAFDADAQVMIDSIDGGFVVSGTCYNSQITQLIKDIALYLKIEIPSQEFISTKNKVLERYSKSIDDATFVRNTFDQLVREKTYSYYYNTDEYTTESTNLSYDKFKSSMKEILGSVKIESLFYGYLERNKINVILTTLKRHFDNNIADSKLKSAGHVQSRDSIKFYPELHHKEIFGVYIYKNFNTNNDNTLSNFFQIGRKNLKMSIILDIFVQFLDRPMREIIMPDEGSLFSLKKSIIDNIMYIVLSMNNTSVDPKSMDLILGKALLKLRETFNTVNQDAINSFIDAKNVVKNFYLRDSLSLKEQSDKIWSEITSNEMPLSNLEEMFVDITFDDLVDLFEMVFFEHPNKLSIQLYAGKYWAQSLVLNKANELYYLNPKFTSNVENNTSFLSRMQTFSATAQNQK